MLQAFTIFPLGDSALTIDFGNTINDDINQSVLHLFHKLRHQLPFIKDVVPAYSSLTVYYDVLSLQTKEKTAFEAMQDLLLPLLKEDDININNQSRKLRIPVCYAKRFAPDLEEIASQKNLTTEDVIHLHSGKIYRVYMIGFLPGFAYMGKVDARIATGRRSSPRTAIAAGSVGIAGEQTGIYPLASPGGWNIIGRTPLLLFDRSKEEPVLLQPGDGVEFYSITEDEFENYQKGHS